MAHKTKATMQGRPSHTNKSTIDTTRACAGGQSLSDALISASALIAALALLVHTPLAVQPTIFKLVANLQLTPLPDVSRSFCRCSDVRIAHPFGSMPFFRKASRPNSLIQLARLTPSDCASFSNCSFNSGLMRIWNGGDFPAPRDWLSLVDMCTPIGIWLLIGVHLSMCVPKITTPQTARTDPGRLTKPLIGVTVMADIQHTQTHPKFTWRFLALSSLGHNIIHITACTEREARELSPAGCVMVFAGRLPAQEVRHV